MRSPHHFREDLLFSQIMLDHVGPLVWRWVTSSQLRLSRYRLVSTGEATSENMASAEALILLWDQQDELQRIQKLFPSHTDDETLDAGLIGVKGRRFGECWEVFHGVSVSVVFVKVWRLLKET